MDIVAGHECFRLGGDFAHHAVLLLDILILRQNRCRMENVLAEIAHLVVSEALIELDVTDISVDVCGREARRGQLTVSVGLESVASRRCELRRWTFHEGLLGGARLVECLIVLRGRDVAILGGIFVVVLIHDEHMLMVLLFLKLLTVITTLLTPPILHRILFLWLKQLRLFLFCRWLR